MPEAIVISKMPGQLVAHVLLRAGVDRPSEDVDEHQHEGDRHDRRGDDGVGAARDVAQRAAGEDGGVADEVPGHRCSLLSVPRCVSAPTMARKTSSRRRLLLDVLDLDGREQLLELGEGAVGDDPALVQDRDPVGEVLGLVEVLGGEQHRRAAVRRGPSRHATPRAAPGGRARWSARRGRSPAGPRSGSSRCRGGDACLRSRSPTRRSAASASWKRAEQVLGDAGRAASRCRSRATSTRFSRPVRISSTAANCPVRLIDSARPLAWVATSKPFTLGRPAVRRAAGSTRCSRRWSCRLRSSPSRAKMLPRATSRSTPRSTCSSP